MATGQSSSIVYAYAVQVDAATTATGTFTTIKRRDGSFTSATADIDDGEQSGARLTDAPGAGRKTHSGTFTMNFRELVNDDFLRSAFASDWVTTGPNSVLSLGKAPVYMTVAVRTEYLNDPTIEYTVYTGVTVSTLGLSFPQDGYIQLSLDLAAANKTQPATAPWTTLNDAAVKNKLRTCVSLTDIQLATKTADALAPFTSYVNTLDFSLANAVEELFDVRQCDPKEIGLGAATVTGNLNSWHDNASDQIARDADTNEQSKLQWTFVGETTTYVIDIPQATNKATGIDPSGTTVGMNLPWGAVTQSPTITRFATI